MMQLDSATGSYADAQPQTLGHKGATLAYRKIQNLEDDPVFLRYLQVRIWQSTWSWSSGLRSNRCNGQTVYPGLTQSLTAPHL